MEKDIGNQLRIYVYRVPKKNHDAIVENQERFTLLESMDVTIRAINSATPKPQRVLLV